MGLKDFTINTPRPLPVIILADVSGSMSVDGKIEVLNTALREMVGTLGDSSRLQAEINLAIITFGGEAKIHYSLGPVHEMEQLNDLVATGRTPMGAAFDIARELIEDKEKLPSRAYRPTIILISDGHPTDTWDESFDALINSDRAKKATRMAMAIGSDADEVMLGKFVNDLEAPLFKAHNARDIHRFFRAVTMSVTSRSASTDPNMAEKIIYEDIPDLNIDDEITF